ncbi:MAG: MaoC family dehydratase [Pseudolabrys sp.]
MPAAVAPSPVPFAVGDEVRATVHFDAEGIRQFATLAGDTNPLHHDEAVARHSRFGGLIASATQTTSLMLGRLAQFVCARATVVGLGYAVKLRRAVPAGATGEIVWRAISIEPKPSLGGDIVRFAGELRINGQAAVTATCDNLVLGPPIEQP